MAKSAGRDCTLKKAAVTIAGGRVLGVSWAGTPIDVTDQGDGSSITYLAAAFSEESLEITFSGVEDGQVLRDIGLAVTEGPKHLADLTFVFPNADTISGNFIMTSYSESGDFRDAMTFDATFVRSGIHTLT